MTEPRPANGRAAVEAAYRGERRRVLATLIRLLGGFEAAEEALHEAFAAAAERWPREGVPRNPYAWLVSTGRFKAVDRWRRQARLARALPELAVLAEPAAQPVAPEDIADDELRLIFTCCHPALPADARVALTLREVGGLTTEAIARAYLVRAPTVAQRIVRAKATIREAGLAFAIPGRRELPERLESVLRVIYLIFNEGFHASEGSRHTRPDLSGEAVRLCRLVVGLTDEAEAHGLLALMLLHEARRASRTDAAGDIVLLEDQDRSLWDRALIAEACETIERAMARRRLGPYLLQAAIAALHAQAPGIGETDWAQIVAHYDTLARLDPSPVVTLNRAVALGMREGPETGLAEIEAAIAQGGLDAYPPAHMARAEMQRRLGRSAAARASYERALALTRQGPERRLIERRIAALSTAG